MKITNEYIKTFNPCDPGIINFDKLYPNYNDHLCKLLALDNISYSDKIWLVCKVVDYKILQQWSIECAENVVENFNKAFPDDNRINECIETTKKYLIGEATKAELSAARSAAEKEQENINLSILISLLENI